MFDVFGCFFLFTFFLYTVDFTVAEFLRPLIIRYFPETKPNCSRSTHPVCDSVRIK